jgi:ABC-type lipoprotein export system ATPase subunit
MKIDRIISLSVVGGFLDGVRVEFASDLNCIIGARGTGKTTILELTRYALDQLPRQDLSPVARRKVEKIIEGNLQGGRVELEIETRDGLRYFITRTAGDEPIVLDANRNPTALPLGANAFFRADIFSQNEVESIADHGAFQLELIDGFAREEINDLNQQADEVVFQIVAHAKRVEPVSTRLEVLNGDIKQLPAIEERLKGLTAKGDQTSEAVNKAHELKALRDREGRTMDLARNFLDEFDDELSQVAGRFKEEFTGKFSSEMLQGPNGERITAVHSQLKTCATEVRDAIRAAREAIERCAAGVAAHDEALRAAHREQELAFQKLIEQNKQHQAKSAERAQLEKRKNKVMEAKAEAKELQKQLANAEKKRAELLNELSDLRDLRFQARKQVAERLNSALSPNIVVSIQQDGNSTAYRELIEESLKGGRVKQGMVAQKLIRTLPPVQLAELIRSGEPVALMERGDLNAEQAASVIAAFNSPEKLAALETVCLEDEPTIRLLVGDQEKDSGALSTGQKCTTILPILLLEGGKPLLVDQPEDNLDNRFIFETVVDSILKVKTARQLIFVTHNPNIPVLGDATQVIVMESGGDHAKPAVTGGVDDCRTEIVTLLEGGAEAFRRRGVRYAV